MYRNLRLDAHPFEELEGRRSLTRFRFPQQSTGDPSIEGGPSANPNPGPSQPPPPPAWQTAMDAFTQFLNGQNGQGGQNQYFVDAANRLLQESQGVNPLFDQYRNAQLGLLGQQQNQQVSQLQSQLAQQGVSGSAAQNEVNRLNAGFNAQGQALSGQIGLQGLDFSNQALQNSLGARSAAITQASYPTAMNIAAMAAQNAGKGGGGGGGGGLFDSCCFIVLEANDGVLPDVVRRYRDEKCTPRKRRGYYRAASVLVPMMKRSPLFKQIIRWGMVKPLTAYGKWFYGQSRFGWLATPLKWAWLGLFTVLGYGKFRRPNGEII